MGQLFLYFASGAAVQYAGQDLSLPSDSIRFMYSSKAVFPSSRQYRSKCFLSDREGPPL